MNRNAPSKPYQDMTTAELREATKEFDKPFIMDTFRPMTIAERARWEKANRRPGRPRVGKGAQVVSVSIERSLLEQADRLARKRKVTRARLIAEGLQVILARTAKSKPAKPRRRAA